MNQYQKRFLEVQKHLWRGDCYQANLALPFQAQVQGGLGTILSQVWSESKNIGAYAHATYFPSINESVIGQSPECLFQVVRKNGKPFLRTMPIKGSIPLGQGKSYLDTWQELVNSKKDEGELFMIADLLRNDLNKIGLPKAKVIKKKAPLKVPGILHQYALIEAPLGKRATLYEIISSLFPGGSVTGAPKKRAMELLHAIERQSRGFYCGSTFIHHREIFQGNINIRAAHIHHSNGQLKYFAGGGITLPSQVETEYEEMLMKAKSFFGLFGLERKTAFRKPPSKGHAKVFLSD